MKPWLIVDIGEGLDSNRKDLGKFSGKQDNVSEIQWWRAETLAFRMGYTLHPDYHMAKITKENAAEWPLTAFVYTSDNAEGIGRLGSMFYMVPAKRCE